MRKRVGTGRLWLCALLLFIVGIAIRSTRDGYVQEFLVGFGTFFGLLLLLFLALIAWSYRKNPPSRNPFQDGVIALFLSRKKRRAYEELIATLGAYDPDRFLQAMDVFLKEQKLPKGFYRQASDSRAVAYLQKGEMGRAIDIWKQAAADEQKMRDMYKIHDDGLRVVTHYNLCFAYLENGQAGKARESYRILKEMGASKMWEAHLPAVLSALDAKFFLVEGKYEEARDAYEELLRRSDNPAQLLHEYYDIALIYEALGDVKKQKECLEQVVKHGNKHYKAAKARGKLADMR